LFGSGYTNLGVKKHWIIIMINLLQLKPKIESICRVLPIKRLDLFGSVLTQNFAPGSDVDVLVLFDSDENIDLFDKYFELKEQLEKIFKRKVDLVVDKPFRNPIFRKSVDKTRIAIYER
jgi:predicted nucleotidyltransferase